MMRFANVLRALLTLMGGSNGHLFSCQPQKEDRRSSLLTLFKYMYFGFYLMLDYIRLNMN